MSKLLPNLSLPLVSLVTQIDQDRDTTEAHFIVSVKREGYMYRGWVYNRSAEVLVGRAYEKSEALCVQALLKAAYLDPIIDGDLFTVRVLDSVCRLCKSSTDGATLAGRYGYCEKCWDLYSNETGEDA